MLSRRLYWYLCDIFRRPPGALCLSEAEWRHGQQQIAGELVSQRVALATWRNLEKWPTPPLVETMATPPEGTPPEAVRLAWGQLDALTPMRVPAERERRDRSKVNTWIGAT